MQKLTSVLVAAIVVACGTEDAVDLPGARDAGVIRDAGSTDAAEPECPTGPRECSQIDALRCGASGVEICALEGACPVWTALVECTAPTQCVDGRCVACAGASGSFRDQSITVDGEDRRYFLHVPAAYECTTPSAVLVDFHGTAGDFPEEAYRHAELIDLANREGFIVVRPRSRFSEGPFGRVYRWDQNPGDLERNVRFTQALLRDLGQRYRIDSERVYASGFSSGTNMTSQFLGRDAQLFSGYGFVGGGVWTPPPLRNLGEEDFRVYAVTGYRDYLLFALEDLIVDLQDQGVATDRIFFRENDAGHELYAWHFDELWAWLDRGERPQDGPLRSGWRRDTNSPPESLIDLALAADGQIYATSRSGTIYVRSPEAGDWRNAGAATGPFAGAALTGICVHEDGSIVAVGSGAIVTSDDGLTFTTLPSAPEFLGQYFGYAYFNGVDCFGERSTIAAGYWSGAVNDAFGATPWRVSRMTYGGSDNPAQLATVRVSGSTTAIAAGYFYLGRSTSALSEFDDVGIPPGVDWLNDVTPGSSGRWWTVGEGGNVFTSMDDGITWMLQASSVGDDLYAVDFFDDDVGMAVGLHGTAIITDDGGITWRDVSTGLDTYLGDVEMLDATTAIAIGGDGTALFYER